MGFVLNRGKNCHMFVTLVHYSKIEVKVETSGVLTNFDIIVYFNTYVPVFVADFTLHICNSPTITPDIHIKATSVSVS